VYPALAVIPALRAKQQATRAEQRATSEQPNLDPQASALKPQPSILFLWLGSRRGPERDLVTREGIPFEVVPSGPLAGVGWPTRILSAVQIITGTIKALTTVWRFRPQALLITGGWVTIPAALACWLSRIPIMIYTPDTEPGGTIRVLSRIAARVGTISAESLRYYRPGQAVETGYPLRAELLQAAGFDALGRPLPSKTQDILTQTRKQAREHFGLSGKHPVLLVLGGSTGARGLSQALVACLPPILEGWQVLHLAGKRDWDWVQVSAAELPAATAGRYHPYPYLHSGEMALALAAADLALSRAGASVLGEFPLFELPAILVPYPYAWRYQKTNADVLASRGAAIRVDEENLPHELVPLLARLLADASERKRMAAASGALKKPEAAARLAEELLAISHRQ
jgi:UDP-N-acetylglucosamine--N-acetylmuramyl-(pentapeptide) pyrophosphoryl-undecaprenol N-acetylglucosamine transferase